MTPEIGAYRSLTGPRRRRRKPTSMRQSARVGLCLRGGGGGRSAREGAIVERRPPAIDSAVLVDVACRSTNTRGLIGFQAEQGRRLASPAVAAAARAGAGFEWEGTRVWQAAWKAPDWAGLRQFGELITSDRGVGCRATAGGAAGRR